jgi:uncharacterized protein YxjI
MNLLNHDKIIVQQRRELVELLGFETRNKYEISDEHKNIIGFCAEQNKGILGFLFRQFLGHWRSFELHFFDHNRNFSFKSIHPFRFFFQEFSIVDADGRLLGRIYQRFGIFTKKFDVADAQGQVLMTMRSGFFSFWTFPVIDLHSGQQKAIIKKKWSGLFKEMFLDADNFLIEFFNQANTAPKEDHKKVILAASVFVDLQYFERKS